MESPLGWGAIEGLTEAGVGIPEAGVDARDEFMLDEGTCPLTPLAPVCTVEGFFAPHANGVDAGAAAFGPPPRAGKASSEWVSNEATPLDR